MHCKQLVMSKWSQLWEQYLRLPAVSWLPLLLLAEVHVLSL